MNAAAEVLARCDAIAQFTDSPGQITRTFLSAATKRCHAYLSAWMKQVGAVPSLDAAGNLRAVYPADRPAAKRLLIGSHIDTIPNAGRYDGVLGVVLAVKLLELLRHRRLPFEIEVIAFSEEEGVRFGVPFIGSRALIGDLDENTLNKVDGDNIAIRQVISDFGLDPNNMPAASMTPETTAYLEFHIEQGPVLESLDVPLGVVDSIVGQSRALVHFAGTANHAGTTPMSFRKDALCAAAEWLLHVEGAAATMPGLLATVGMLNVSPNAGNCVPGDVTASLDVRHAEDATRSQICIHLLRAAQLIAHKRGVQIQNELLLDQPAVPMNDALIAATATAIQSTNYPVHRMASGAGHDAMIVARKLPCAMIFLRSPGGLSHHPDETVVADDVAAALSAGTQLLENLGQCSFLI